MILDDVQGAVLGPVAERNHAAHPHALFFRSSNLVANSLSCELTFKLGEGQKHVERESAHGIRRIELLRDGNKADFVGVEHFNDLREIS